MTQNPLLLLVSIVILCVVLPISGEWTSSTNAPCVLTLLADDCSAVTVDNATVCCMQITQATSTDTVCMCGAFSNDTDFVDGYRAHCTSANDLQVRMACPDIVLATPSPVNSTTTTNNTTPAVNSTTPPSPSGKKGSSTITAVVVSIVVVVVLAIAGISIVCIRKRKGLKNERVLPSQSLSHGDNNKVNFKSEESLESKSGFKPDQESSEYDLETLKTATNNFSIDNKIGGGGFGFVYKGILQNGLEIAVKRLSPDSGQGEKEFQAEVELLAKLKHRNLVQLLGFCLMNDEALLVYELAVNKSLDYFLFDSEAQRAKLKWSNRFEIIKGVARGMLYLHDDAPEKTIHRDLKAANVLLDAHMKPKIADFGLARKCGPEQTRAAQTYNIMGTRGYMAPEYYRGEITLQTDVYAFGVLILEIITGRSVNGYSTDDSGNLPEDLLKYVWRCWYDDKNSLELIMDPLMKDSFSSYEVQKCIQLGLLCVQEKSTERPKMSKILHNLNSGPQSAVLPTPRCPQDVFLGGPQAITTSSTTAPSSGVISSATNISDFKNPR